MRSLIERQGGLATVAPSMREIPLEENTAVFAFGEALLAGQIDILVFLTGVGARALREVLEARWPFDVLRDAMSRTTVVVRGPKPTAVLRDWGLRIDYRAPEPNTWRELLATLEQNVDLAGRRIAIQEYGKPNEELYAALRARGGTVRAVPVYRWDLPEDVQPLRDAIAATIAGQFDVILFTSAQQFHNLISVAKESGAEAAWRDAARRTVIASIGPTATETLVEGGVTVDLEPTHPKMGTLVREALASGHARWAAKQLSEESGN